MIDINTTMTSDDNDLMKRRAKVKRKGLFDEDKRREELKRINE